MKPRPDPHVIHPSAVYTVATLQAALSLTKSTVAREVRLRRLRATKRAGRYYILGTWILEWLKDGEVRQKAKLETETAHKG
jgi:hypothetical protein